MSWFQQIFGNPTTSGGRVDGPTARQMVQKGATLIDVRTPPEFSQGHIKESRNVPLSDLAEGTAKLDKNGTYVLVCLSGARSARAADWMRQHGFTDVHDLGGYRNW